MNKCNESIASLEEEARFITSVLNAFFEILESKNIIEISNPHKQKIFKEVNQHYKAHRDTYKKICYVKNGDIFKIISWAAMFLYQEKETKAILLIACAYMNEQLKKINRQVSKELICKIVEMLLNDSKKDNVAIGKNGLYMSFRLASEVKQIKL
ncbi:hypothetical protein OQH61_08645 [Helicobacter sp. MIT 21-1697]|uniref:hypothetical protein n=1 Tax=Helicobacter sp. MIT 21-1697 TaxID=2993733 RepID=UPI00224B9529|nr:hypothetical protein [Helicobacter sp. MIT 21-1697]MCX2717798.1 hypothetical protein [Helicobacter sp. MIT 21-1697]